MELNATNWRTGCTWRQMCRTSQYQKFRWDEHLSGTSRRIYRSVSPEHYYWMNLQCISAFPAHTHFPTLCRIYRLKITQHWTKAIIFFFFLYILVSKKFVYILIPICCYKILDSSLFALSPISFLFAAIVIFGW